MWLFAFQVIGGVLCLAAKSPCSPTERRVSRSTQSYGSFTITPFTTSKENLPVLNTRIICPGKHTHRHREQTIYKGMSYVLVAAPM